MQLLMKQVNGLRLEWVRPSTWSHMEQRNLFEGVAPQLMELSDEEWNGLRMYLATPTQKGSNFYKPNTRSRFVETFPDVFAAYLRWLEKNPHHKSKPVPAKGACQLWD